MSRTTRARPRRTLFRIGTWQLLQPRAWAVPCLAIAAFAMAILPELLEAPGLPELCVGVMCVIHWAVAIGVPAQVENTLDRSGTRWRGWGFVLGVLLLGGIGFVWTAPAWVWRAWGYSIQAEAPDYMLISHVVPVVLSLRYGLSFVQCRYAGCGGKMSGPEIRALLGPALRT